jgi:hypothetical protein
MSIVFFDYEEAVRHENVPEGQTINEHFRFQVMSRLHDAVRLKM